MQPSQVAIDILSSMGHIIGTGLGKNLQGDTAVLGMETLLKLDRQGIDFAQYILQNPNRKKQPIEFLSEAEIDLQEYSLSSLSTDLGQMYKALYESESTTLKRHTLAQISNMAASIQNVNLQLETLEFQQSSSSKNVLMANESIANLTKKKATMFQIACDFSTFIPLFLQLWTHMTQTTLSTTLLSKYSRDISNLTICGSEDHTSTVFPMNTVHTFPPQEPINISKYFSQTNQLHLSQNFYDYFSAICILKGFVDSFLVSIAHHKYVFKLYGQLLRSIFKKFSILPLINDFPLLLGHIITDPDIYNSLGQQILFSGFLSYISSIPNLSLVSPKQSEEILKCLRSVSRYQNSPHWLSVLREQLLTPRIERELIPCSFDIFKSRRHSNNSSIPVSFSQTFENIFEFIKFSSFQSQKVWLGSFFHAFLKVFIQYDGMTFPQLYADPSILRIFHSLTLHFPQSFLHNFPQLRIFSTLELFISLCNFVDSTKNEHIQIFQRIYPIYSQFLPDPQLSAIENLFLFKCVSNFKILYQYYPNRSLSLFLSCKNLSDSLRWKKVFLWIDDCINNHVLVPDPFSTEYFAMLGKYRETFASLVDVSISSSEIDSRPKKPKSNLVYI